MSYLFDLNIAVNCLYRTVRGATKHYWTAFPAICSHVVVFFPPSFHDQRDTDASRFYLSAVNIGTGFDRKWMQGPYGPCGALHSLGGDFILKPDAGKTCIFKNTHLCVKPPHKGLVASEIEVI